MVNGSEGGSLHLPFTIYYSLSLLLLFARVTLEAEFVGGVGGERVRLVVGREGPVAHVLGVGLDGLVDCVADVRVLAHEARARLAEGEAEQVVRDEYLRVAVGAGTDADGRDVKRGRHLARDLARDDFENDGEGARLFEQQRVLDERARGVGRLRLQTVAAEIVQG